MSHPTRQHFVPRLLLREFTDLDSGLVYVYDKHDDRAFQATPKRIGAQNSFYDLEVSESITLTAEEGLSRVEGSASKIIDKIRLNESMDEVSEKERARLALFIAVQTYRVPHMRKNLLHTSNLMEEFFERIGIDPSEVENWESMDPEDAKRLTLEMMAESAETLAPHIFNKLWFLQRTTIDQPFYISDNPVALHNEPSRGPFGNIGFAVEGVQIHLPISRTLSLFLLCPSHGPTIRSVRNQLWGILKNSPRSSRSLWDAVLRSAKLNNALDYGSPIDLKPANVRHHNSLQVKYASRWIYAPSPDFKLVKEMLKDNESFRTGPLMQVDLPQRSSNATPSKSRET